MGTSGKGTERGGGEVNHQEKDEMGAGKIEVQKYKIS